MGFVHQTARCCSLAAKQVVAKPWPKPLHMMAIPETGHDKAAKTKCGRCHAVDEGGRKNDIGSTPSFFVLKVFDDWEDRFTCLLCPAPAWLVHPDQGRYGTLCPQNMPPPDHSPVEMTLGRVGRRLGLRRNSARLLTLGKNWYISDRAAWLK